MRAAVLNEYNTPLVIEELEDPPLGPRDVRVQIDASGVCHSDLTVQKGGVPMPVPIVLGHEGAGTVLEVGKEVSRVKTGDTVIASKVVYGGKTATYVCHSAGGKTVRQYLVSDPYHGSKPWTIVAIPAAAAFGKSVLGDAVNVPEIWWW